MNARKIKLITFGLSLPIDLSIDIFLPFVELVLDFGQIGTHVE